MFSLAYQAALAARIPNAQLAIIEDAGHNAPMERPAEVIESIKRFMEVAGVRQRRYLDRFRTSLV